MNIFFATYYESPQEKIKSIELHFRSLGKQS